MFNKKNKAKQSEAQKLQAIQRKEEFDVKIKFIKEQFYPALCKATTSIEDALQNLTIINSIMMEKFLGKMKETTMKDINIYTNLSMSDPNYEALKSMLELFDDKNVFETKEYFEGMRGEISLFLNDEQKERKLEDLKTVWADEVKS